MWSLGIKILNKQEIYRKLLENLAGFAVVKSKKSLF